MDVERKAERGEEGYKMNVELISQDAKTKKSVFAIKDTTTIFVNTLRRLIMEEVPTLAIEDVELRDHSSALYDEMVAHRLGLSQS